MLFSPDLPETVAARLTAVQWSLGDEELVPLERASDRR